MVVGTAWQHPGLCAEEPAGAIPSRQEPTKGVMKTTKNYRDTPFPPSLPFFFPLSPSFPLKAGGRGATDLRECGGVLRSLISVHVCPALQAPSHPYVTTPSSPSLSPSRQQPFRVP
ncbi:hypothetical protein GWK47_032791 [Chionoecetes opilio]|uniref:Uncharacterized protein n=1 Tax=Chionoecetes opilio TaxID=41210 RepID=A0A8J4YQ15_CHIOP|nr:hypothetical protein GWK47_032791 [Chionoecetes opilio]